MNRSTRVTLFLSALLLSLLALALYGCDTEQQPRSLVDTATPATPTPTVTDAPTVLIEKAAVLIGENKGYNQVRNGAPKIKALGDRYGHATNVKACTHPSQPNYVCIAAGSTRGVTSNTVSPRLSGPTIMGRTIKAGGTAAVFAQSQGSDNCRMTQRGYFHPRHYYGWPLFKDERALCEQFGLGYEKIKPRITDGTLPQQTLIVPNNCSNSHDCSLRTADTWISTEVARLMAGPDYQAGRLVIIITWDEDDHTEGNHVDLVVIHPSLDHVVVTKALNLVSLHMTLARVGQVAPIKTTTNDLATAFGLPIKEAS